MKDDMSCGFDKGLLAAHYDGETTADERVEVERHVAGCPECARDLASMKDLTAALKPLARGSAPMSIAEGVMREIRPAPRRWGSWAASAAAALLLAVGTVMIVNRQTAPSPKEPVAAAEQPEKKRFNTRIAESKAPEMRESAPKAAEAQGDLPPDRERKAHLEAPAPSADPPAEREERKDSFGQESELKDERLSKAEDRPAVGAGRGKAQAPPVLRVASADLPAARRTVEAFMAERKMKTTPGAPLLGSGEFVEAHYLQLELTDEESAALQKRLAELQETAVATGSFEEERKRVAAEVAKEGLEKVKKFSRAADSKDDAGKSAKEPAAENPRGRALSPDAPVRKKFIFVFEPLPKK